MHVGKILKNDEFYVVAQVRFTAKTIAVEPSVYDHLKCIFLCGC